MDQSKDSRAGDDPTPRDKHLPDEHPSESKKTPAEEPNDEQEGAPGRNGHSLAWYAAWATIISIPVGILTAIAIALFAGGNEVSISAESPRKAQLERIDLIARNGLPPQKPALELLVRNGGRGTAVISRAEIEVLRVYSLPLCFTQGALPVSESYGVRLPPDAKPGETIEAPLHQQVGTSEADRFKIRLSVDLDRVREYGVAAGELGAEEGDGQLPGFYIFEIAVALVHDGGGAPLEMGTALVSLPGLPLGGEYLLEEGGFKRVTETFLTSKPLLEIWGEPISCWQANGRTAMRARGSDGTRSPQLEEILSAAAIPRWSEVEG